MSYSSNPQLLLTQPISQNPPAHIHNKSFDYTIDPLSGYNPYVYSNPGYSPQMTSMNYYGGSYPSPNNYSWKDGMGYYYSGMQPIFYPETETNAKQSFEMEPQKAVYSIYLMDVLAKKDNRTTIMIKNIPNKYTQKMLLKKIDKKFKNIYDFFYLPIDLKNKCNVGYAFINFINPVYILKFYEEFNGQHWEKFKSEKICQLAYARIQGHQALLMHFRSYNNMFQQNVKVRPLIFPERRVDPVELAEYEKSLRTIMTEKRINELMQLNYMIFGKK